MGQRREPHSLKHIGGVDQEYRISDELTLNAKAAGETPYNVDVKHVILVNTAFNTKETVN